MAQRLAGKIALITGGASGLGAAQARLFAREGARVAVADLQDEPGGRVVADIVHAGGEALYVHLDVTSPESWTAALEATRRAFGGLTILVNNAGIFHPGGVEAETIEGWNRMVAVNQTGVFLGMKLAMPLLLESGNAAVVNISSLFGILSSPNALTYHASKAAVRLMGKAAAREFASRGVRVNTIFPGQIQTPILGDITPEQDAAFKAAIPLQKVGEPDDIAYGSLFLCSDEAKYVTGTELRIDGGWGA